MTDAGLDRLPQQYEIDGIEWAQRDVLLYALSVGAGPADLDLCLEAPGRPPRVLPTFAVTVAHRVTEAALTGLAVPAGAIVHAEQAVTLHREVPAEGRARSRARVADVAAKRSGALVVIDAETVSEPDGEPLWSTRSSVFVRGAGGSGGSDGSGESGGTDRSGGTDGAGESGGSGEARGGSEGSGGSGEPTVPDHDADLVLIAPTREDQALLYRLNGDRNPLHADPEVARAAGFERPILHGLCTYGIVARVLLHAMCGSDAGRMRGFAARFTAPVIPGEPLRIQTWEASETEVHFRASVGDRVVLDRGHLQRG